nr:MAG TPA: barstar [Microviridae sp. ctOX110]
MKLMLVRDSFSSNSTDGVLFVDSRPFCNTLEPAQGKKVKFGKGCCIAPGLYSIDLHYSPKFGKYMLTLCGVRGRSGILIHSGNTPRDTVGCILVGKREECGRLSYSGSNLDKLFDCCLEAISKEPITIIIKNK